MQDQAFLGPEAGLAVPAEDGGIDLYVATQWLHVDQQQICRALALPPEKVRLTLAGVGGAFGGREDLSMHVHACLLAMHTGKPVKMSYNREESFFGTCTAIPRSCTTSTASRATGTLVYVRAEIWLDGGAYASSSAAVVGNAGLMGIGPYVVPNVHMDCYGAYTNNPPCGAMRGFGAVQAAFAYEAQMDKAATALGMHPVELRSRNAMELGSVAPTGQVVDSPAPVAELVQRLADLPLPPARQDAPVDLRAMPGGVSNCTHGEGVRRGVGYAVAYKNIGFSEGFDDYSTARVRLEITGGEPTVTVHTAAAEVGQGLVTVEQQICRSELGVERVVVQPADTRVGSGGSTSASRQTYVTAGRCRGLPPVRAALCERGRRRARASASGLTRRRGRSGRRSLVALGGVSAARCRGDRRVAHRPTEAVDPEPARATPSAVRLRRAPRRRRRRRRARLVKVVELPAPDVGKAITRGRRRPDPRRLGAGLASR
jgi:CO/xanthine dehydrogenase Mo-binding subunit